MRPGRKIWAGLLAATLAAGSWFIPTSAQAAASDLIISEYVEGSSNNKYIELYNGTGADIDLSQYTVELYTNGSTAPNNKATLSGTLAAGDTFVIRNGQAVLYADADLTASVTNFNGDDPIVLKKGDAVVDSLGQIGDLTKFGTDVTLVRKPSVTAGDTNPTDAFDVNTEWEIRAKDDVSDLGKHTMDGSTDPVDPVDPEPTPEPTDDCKADATLIGAVQGKDAASPKAGQTVTIQGTVVGDFQEGGFNGYYLQDAGDGDAATSDGIFVYDQNKVAGDVKVGDVLRVTGPVKEHYEMTQVTAANVTSCGTTELPAPTVIDFPSTGFEAYEGMLVSFKEPLTVLELYQYGRYGQIAVGPERQFQPSALYDPSSAEARAELESNMINRVLIDDGRSNQNPTPAIHPATLEPLTMDNLFRAGDQISGVAGVLDYRFSNWALQPTQAGTIANTNPRPAVPEVGGNLTVASFNVLNYFTTLTSQDSNARGAETAEEFKRQQAKIVTAINKADAAIVGLNEIENNGTAVNALVAALNEAAGTTKWAALETGKIGTDAITTAFIYQPALVNPVGDFDTLTTADDPRFIDTKNRPTLAQTFEHLASGETITVAVNHLKSKGSACGDPSEATLNALVGNCNETRTEAAKALSEWISGDSIGVQKSENLLIIGDLNSYDHEDPIKVFEAAGFTDLAKKFQGEKAYSYVFDGQLGYLDYALANEALAAKVVGAADWHINSDELPLIDYTMKFKADAEDKLYAPDEFRSSDHDPVIVGIELTKQTEPTPEPTECTVSAATAGKKLVGSGTFLWGTAADCAGETVVVEVKDGDQWVQVGEAVADEHGFYKVSLDSLADAGSYTLRAVVGDEVSEETSLTRVAVSTVAAAKQAPVGRTANVWGTVDGSARVSTQVWIDGKGWSTSQTREVTGGYVIPLTYGQDAAGTYKWRLVVEHAHGEVEVSDTFVQTRVAVPTASSAGAAPVGRTANVWGTVDGQAGAKVWTEVKLANGSWSRSQVGVTNADGGYVLELSYGKNSAGSYTYRVGAEYEGLGVMYSKEFTFVRK